MKNLNKNFFHFFKKILPVGLLITIVLAFFWKVIFLNQSPIPGDFIVGVYYPWLDYKWGHSTGVPVKNPITTDVVSFTYPMQTLAMAQMKMAEKPLWNPYILAGSPLLANFQSAPFSPTSFVYFIFDKITSWNIQVISQHLLAAIFTYFLLRYWKVSKSGSLLGGIIYAFSGYNLIFSEWNGHTLAAAFIPLVLLFEDRLLEKGKLVDGALLSIFLAFQIFSGYTQTSLYTTIAMGLLWFVRIWGSGKFWLRTLTLAFFCLLGLALSSIQLLPSYELIVNSQRAFEPHPYEWSFLPWLKTITFIAPDYFGNHVTRNYWGPQDYTSNTGFVGVVALVLSTFAIFKFKKNKSITFLFLLFVVSLLLSFPTPLSIFLWSKDILSMQANSAHRATAIICAAAAFLSGFGFDMLTEKINKYRLKIYALIPTFIIFLCFIYYGYLVRSESVFGIPSIEIAYRNLILPIGVFIGVAFVFLIKPKFKFLLIPLAILEIFYFGWKYTPFSPREFIYPETPIISFIMNQEKPFRTTGAKVIPSNLRMAYGIESFEGYDTFHPLGVSRFIATLNSGSVESNPTGRYGIVDNDTSRLLDLVNTKYYIALKSDKNIKRFDPRRFEMVFEDKSVQIFESKQVLPRAFMVYDWEVLENDVDALSKVNDPKFPIDKRIVLNGEVDIEKSLVDVKNTVVYEKYGDQESLIKVDTLKDGLLFVSDSYYPGWKAYIDNKEVRIYKADSAFRAIVVPSGKHDVKFVYNPESFSNGLTISGVSALVITGIIGYTLVGKKKNEKH